MIVSVSSSASRTCGSCITQFQILTRSFGADAGKIIISEHAFPITQFIQLNLQFEKSIVKAVYHGHATQGDPVIPTPYFPPSSRIL